MKEDYKKESDELLIERYRLGETDIVEFLMEKYKPLVRKKANAMFLIGGDTDDLIQEGMIGLFKAVRDYRNDRESSFFHFAEICITRQLVSAVEASNRKKHIPLNTSISFNMEDAQGVDMIGKIPAKEALEDPEELLIAMEEQKSFIKLIETRLSKMEKEVLHYYLEGMNYHQIAETMNHSPKSIDNALQRIRGKVRSFEL